MKTHTTRTATALLAALALAVVANGQVRRTIDPGPCRLLLNGIERAGDAIEYTLDRLSRLGRLGGEADRVKIRDIAADVRDEHDLLSSRLATLVEGVDLSCDVCLAEACVKIRPALVDIRDRLVAIHRELLGNERDIRRRIGTAQRVGHAIRVTDRTLVRAAKLARKTDDGEETFPELRRAFELQEDAKQALAAGRFERAGKMTLRARDLIGQTIRAALDSADIEAVRERATAFWKRTNRIIRRVERHVDVDHNPRAARLLGMARREQGKARELVSDYPYRALRHAKAARRMVNQLLRFANRAERCEERAERLEGRLDDAEEAVDESGDEKAVDVLSKSVRHYERGAELCEAGKSGKATVQLDIAAKLAAKAVDIARGATRGEKALVREVRKTRLIVGRAADMAQSDAQKRRVAAAGELVEKAASQTDNPQACLKLLDKATDVAFSVIAASRRQSDGAGEK